MTADETPEDRFFRPMGLYERCPTLADETGSLMDLLLDPGRRDASDAADHEAWVGGVEKRFGEAVACFRRIDVPVPAMALDRRRKDVVNGLADVARVMALRGASLPSLDHARRLLRLVAIANGIVAHLTASDAKAPWADVAHAIRGAAGIPAGSAADRVLRAVAAKAASGGGEAAGAKAGTETE